MHPSPWRRLTSRTKLITKNRLRSLPRRKRLLKCSQKAVENSWKATTKGPSPLKPQKLKKHPLKLLRKRVFSRSEQDDKKPKPKEKPKKEPAKEAAEEENQELKKNGTVRNWRVNIQEIRVTNLLSEKQSVFLVFKIGDNFKLVDSLTPNGKLVDIG